MNKIICIPGPGKGKRWWGALWIGALLGLGTFGFSASGAESSRQTLLADGKPLLVYQAVPNPKKPYVAELFSPCGLNILRDSPGDHKHHHGLMFAVAVDGVNFWAEDAAAGTQLPLGPLQAKPQRHRDAVWQILQQSLRWQNPQSVSMLEEQRWLLAGRTGLPPVSLLTWRSILRVPKGKDSVRLTGSAYFGLGMRFVASMDSGGEFFNAAGHRGVQATNNARACWCAYTAKVDGNPVTVAIFDWPTNPRHPATWFTMDRPFAYISATLNLHQQPLTIQADRPVELRYGVAVWDGRVSSARIQKCYKRWLDLGWTEPTPSVTPTPAKP